jgi:glycosyltransferase involved in cell wall biosynthesis
MKVSIITVTYNSEKHIERCINSVLQQNYSNIEFIIIDGNSSDLTLDLISKFKKYISYFISEDDNGIYDAMNKGILQATGDIIGILNSDDFFYDNYVISKIVDFHTNNNLDASIGNILQCNKDQNFTRKYSSFNWKPKNLLIGSMPPHPSIFIKKSIFYKLGFYRTDISIAADYDLIVRYFYINQIKWKYLDATTTIMQSGGVSSSGLKSYLKITNQICSILSNYNLPFSPIKIKFRFTWKLFEKYI